MAAPTLPGETDTVQSGTRHAEASKALANANAMNANAANAKLNKRLHVKV